MAVEYRLTRRGHPSSQSCHTGTSRWFRTDQAPPYVLGADLSDQGLDLTVYAGQAGCLDAPAESWEWESATYVNIIGRLDADPDLRETGTHAMLDIVAPVLSTGIEDAALMLNGDYLLLTRVNGKIEKYRRAVW